MFKIENEKISLTEVGTAQEKISQAGNILVVTHRNPDGDAIGSVIAMLEYLRSLNKRYTAFCFDSVPSNLEYLKNSHEIISDIGKLKGQEFDMVITLDCADVNYSGIGEFLIEMKYKGVEIVNIDHHPKSDYGSLNVNYSQASSTAEILYNLFQIWGVKISPGMATGLLAGILVDTGNFTNSATGKETLGIAAELVELGGRYSYANKQLHQNQDKHGLRLWSKVLNRLQKNDRLKVAYSVIVAEDIEETGWEATEGVANFFNYLDGVKLVMVLKEKGDGEIKVSLRSLAPGMDVARLARVFGGGGHVKAAGFSLRGRLEKEGNYWRII